MFVLRLVSFALVFPSSWPATHRWVYHCGKNREEQLQPRVVAAIKYTHFFYYFPICCWTLPFHLLIQTRHNVPLFVMCVCVCASALCVHSMFRYVMFYCLVCVVFGWRVNCRPNHALILTWNKLNELKWTHKVQCACECEWIVWRGCVNIHYSVQCVHVLASCVYCVHNFDGLFCYCRRCCSCLFLFLFLLLLSFAIVIDFYSLLCSARHVRLCLFNVLYIMCAMFVCVRVCKARSHRRVRCRDAYVDISMNDIPWKSLANFFSSPLNVQVKNGRSRSDASQSYL